MMYEQFLAAEAYLEPAACSLLKQRGFKVASPFVQVLGTSPNGDPILAPTPDESCTVVFQFQRLDGGHKVYATVNGVRRSVPGVIEGVLEISHQVPASGGDAPQPGEPPSCYPKLLAQRGRIRAIFAGDDSPFGDLLPAIDFLSLEIPDPDRSVNRELIANRAVERIRLRIAPKDDLA